MDKDQIKEELRKAFKAHYDKMNKEQKLNTLKTYKKTLKLS